MGKQHIVKVLPTQWVEVKYQGRTYLVHMRTLLGLYDKEKGDVPASKANA